MKTISAICMGIILLIIDSCSGGRYMEMTKTGEEAYQAGDFRKALEYSEQIIDEVEEKGKKASGNVYTLAGVSAFELEDYTKSLNYLVKAEQQEYSEENMYLHLAMNYRHVDNLSKEISALETYMAKYPYGKDIETVRERLFQSCLESENFELAEDLWNQMNPASRDDIRNLEIYLNLNRSLQ
ncbi:tetratricopeptide repeat protein, partial [Bacteroidota bacterium]